MYVMIILQQRLFRHKAVAPGQLTHSSRDQISAWRLYQAGHLPAPFELGAAPEISQALGG